ncbi:hypothetical protein [Chryseobacterium indologenes]|uniref:hypothetical protein n=1 Tax=Chryseobacterium indologenes TaxID=253 RepID=UPI001628A0C7|nr:hypothetical protein [Chryseobacterium indologenes]
MFDQYLELSKTALSLTFNLFDNTLSGDTKFIAWAGDRQHPEVKPEVNFTFDAIFNLDPNPSFSGDDVTISIISLNEGIGDYEFNIEVYSLNIVKNLKIYLKVINEDKTPEDQKPYKLKYFFENETKSGDVFKCEILERGYLGPPVNVNGSCDFKYQDKSDHFQPIVTSSLNLKLIASEELSLQDLYAEDERHFRVTLKRNDEIIFIGFLKPDGIWEDFVYDRWELTIDAFDGLSTLKSMSFSNDNGIPFSGKYRAFDIIRNCIKKTGLDLPINVNCAVMYDASPGSFNTFETIYMSTERYFQSGSDPMDSESVLSSILRLFNATLIQFKGEWYIYRSIDLDDKGTTFNQYIDGLYVKTFSIHPSVAIGSHINNFQLFHCSSNQKKSISASVQAYRVTYQYGNANAVYSNGELQLSGSGLDIPGWTVNNFDGNVQRLDGGKGLTSKVYTGSGDPRLITLNQSIDINGGAMIKLIISFANENVNSVGLTFALGVNGKYFDINSQQWLNTGHINFVANYFYEGQYPGGAKICRGRGAATYELVVQAPESGTLDVSIYRDKHPVGAGDFKIYSVTVMPNDSGNIKGRDYTAWRTKKVSTVTKPNETVYNGDSLSDLFNGTIYKVDADTPTSKWFRLSDPPGIGFKELLEINVEDNLRVAPRPMIIFEGDVFGYIPFLSLIEIDGFGTKRFQPTSYSFDTSSGILRLTSREISTAYLKYKDEYDFSVKDNYGNETKVTIV